MSTDRPQKQKGSQKQAKLENQLSRQQKHENWKQSKVERAALDGFNVIRQETKDVALLINLANGHDNIMKYLRLNVGLNPRITLDKFDEIIRLSNEAKEKLNEVNAIAYQLAGKKYSPPRGMKDPLKKPQLAAATPAKEKQKQKPTVAKTPEVAGSETTVDIVAEEPVAAAV